MLAPGGADSRPCHGELAIVRRDMRAAPLIEAYCLPRLRQATCLEGRHIVLAKGVQMHRDQGAVVEPQNAEAACADHAHDELTHMLEQRAAEVQLVQDIILASLSCQRIDDAIRDGLRRVCELRGWSVGHVVLFRGEQAEPAAPLNIWHFDNDNRFIGFQSISEKVSYQNSDGLIAQILSTGEMHVVDDMSQSLHRARGEAAGAAGLSSAVALPVKVGSLTMAVMEFFSMDRISVDEPTLNLLNCVAAQFSQVIQHHVLEKSVADSMWLLERRVGRELHDTVCQDLVGLAFLGRGIVHALEAEGSDQAAETAELVAGLEQALTQTRAISKGLSPVECAADELPHAMRDLARNTEHRFGIPCVLDAPRRLVLANDAQARHLYFIAHEAVTNAVKHSQASRIAVTLTPTDGQIELRVSDDGVGFEGDHDASSGIGLRVMHHRANLIGARCDVHAEPGHGVTMTCRLPVKDADHGNNDIE